MTEHDIQDRIRVALSARGCKVFRVNVVEAWAGEEHRLPDGSILIRNPRRVASGVPRGFSDLLVILPGGRAAFVECKGPRGRPTKEQNNFISQMQHMGCRAGIARSTEGAIKIIEEGY